MRRGEIWTVSAGGVAGKPRPAVVVQDERFSDVDTVTICGFTSDPTDAPIFRIDIAPSDSNGLQKTSRLMVDKLTTVRKTKLGKLVGRLDYNDQARLNRAILVFLGLA